MKATDSSRRMPRNIVNHWGSTFWQLLVKSVSLQFIDGPLQQQPPPFTHTYLEGHCYCCCSPVDIPIRKQRHESNNVYDYCIAVRYSVLLDGVSCSRNQRNSRPHDTQHENTRRGTGRGSHRRTPLDLMFRVPLESSGCFAVLST